MHLQNHYVLAELCQRICIIAHVLAKRPPTSKKARVSFHEVSFSVSEWVPVCTCPFRALIYRKCAANRANSRALLQSPAHRRQLLRPVVSFCWHLPFHEHVYRKCAAICANSRVLSYMPAHKCQSARPSNSKFTRKYLQPAVLVSLCSTVQAISYTTPSGEIDEDGHVASPNPRSRGVK